MNNQLLLANTLACFFAAWVAVMIAHQTQVKSNFHTLIYLAICIYFAAAGVLDLLALLN